MVKYFASATTAIDLELKAKFKEKCKEKKVSMHAVLRNFILDFVKEEQENESNPNGKTDSGESEPKRRDNSEANRPDGDPFE